MVNLFLLFCVFITLSSCAPFVDSPFSDKLLRPERDLNQASVGNLKDFESDGIVRIAIFTDPHQNYKDLDRVFYEINQTDGIDFVAGLGDYTNSGYNLEYDQFISALSTVKWPRVMALGNHDAIGAGPELFAKAFGPANFYFENSNRRYIFFNGNNWETPRDFKINWLQEAVDGANGKKVIIFSHVQLLDHERFNSAELALLTNIVQDPDVQLALNGHNHVYSLAEESGTFLLQVGRAQDLHWVVLEITGTQLCIKRMDTKETDCRTLK